jgi:SAM-dependent methyltransferase
MEQQDKPVPFLGRWLHRLKRWPWSRPPEKRAAEEVFTDIYRRNGWRGEASVSGTGSDLVQTERIVAALPALFARHRIRSILDIPCGDFHWMRTVNLEGISYLGADIVPDLIEQNQRYASANVVFRRLNLLQDPLPTVDLILCRDCLVHFSFDDVFQALRSIVASGSSWLLTTTFPARRFNRSILTGQWRPLNLEHEPFRLPPPIELITEGCTEGKGRYRDKALGLWNICELKDRLVVNTGRPGG